MSSHPPAPTKKREPLETIALRVIIYGAGSLVVGVCLLLAWIMYRFSLFPSVLDRLIVLFLLACIIVYVPISIKKVYAEIARRAG